MTTALPTIEEIARISAMPDGAQRNLAITRCYFDLSRALTARTGACANWCTFATWASRQAGQTIRMEDLKQALDDLLAQPNPISLAVERLTVLLKQLGSDFSLDALRSEIRKALHLLPVFEHTSQAVARGNVKVFAEIGKEFSRFLHEFLNDTSPDPQKLKRFLEALTPGDPPDGQEYLRQAFTHLYAALFEEDVERKAQLILLANIEMGFHEQTRLQPEIQAALDSPYVDGRQIVDGLIAVMFPTGALLIKSRAWLMRLLRRATPLDLAAQVLANSMRTALRSAITDAMMTISLSDGLRLRLAKDLQGEYPLALRQVRMPELLTMLKKIDPTPDSLRDSGAGDWAYLPERLHYIIDMFRLYQEYPAVLLPPFSDEPPTG